MNFENWQPTIKEFPAKYLIGKKTSMSIARNQTQELWQDFMSSRTAIKNQVGTDLYSVQRYTENYFQHFDPLREFEKWAAVEAVENIAAPPDFEAMTLTAGLYAVFSYVGPVSEGPKVFKYIFQDWLPTSGYLLDDRLHFEVLGPKYNNEAADSEEDICIPIKNIKHKRE